MYQYKSFQKYMYEGVGGCLQTIKIMITKKEKIEKNGAKQIKNRE